MKKNFKIEKKFAKNKNLKIAKNRAGKTKIWDFLEKIWREKFLEILKIQKFFLFKKITKLRRRSRFFGKKKIFKISKIAVAKKFWNYFFCAQKLRQKTKIAAKINAINFEKFCKKMAIAPKIADKKMSKMTADFSEILRDKLWCK